MPTISGIPDAVSDVLSLVRMRGEMVCANEYASHWSVGFRKPVGHFHIVERGSAWIRVAGRKPVRIETGDLALLPLGAGHSLSSDPDLKPTPIEKAIAQRGVRNGAVCTIGSGEITAQILCGQFAFDGVLAPKLLTRLPSLIHLKAQGGKPLEWLRLTSHFLVEETRHPRPGSAILVARLLDLLFIQAIRDWGAHHRNHVGWLSGLRDDRIGHALSAIHAEPSRNWTVEMLARIAGMSRSGFAARFLEVVGQTPLKYVAGWRLNLTADHLRAGGLKVMRIAELVGYGSEAALNRAFKQQFGTTPAAFRKAKANGGMR